MTRIELTRHVVADPAGVALLLAEPASWPDPDRDDQGWVVAPPRHVGDRFTAVIEAVQPVEAPGRMASGQVIVKPTGEVGCEIRLVINVRDHATAARVEESAATFLAVLGDRAQARSLAA
jgi:hypothetical protein